MAFTGFFSRAFMFGVSTTEVHGLEQFLKLVDERKDIDKRQRGLVTVSNHISVVDDPLIWGSIPLRYNFNPSNHRWSLGSYDICFQNKILSTFFTLGQVLPTHRHDYSTHGGLFQPTMTQAVRLLSKQPFTDGYGRPDSISIDPSAPDPSILSPDLDDPFSSPHLTYSTTGVDTFPAPSSYLSRRYSWLHIFPEGRVHQHPRKTMRYFKWGVARLILEPDECPDIVPIWIEGNDQVMHEAREWPRWAPRVGKQLGIWFGENVGGESESVFSELRRQWRKLVEDERRRRGGAGEREETGVLNEALKYGKEATELRIECTRQIRAEMLKLRRQRGLPDEDPKEGLKETWTVEGGKVEGWMKDGSWVKEM